MTLLGYINYPSCRLCNIQSPLLSTGSTPPQWLSLKIDEQTEEASMYAKPVMAALCVCLALPVAAGVRQGPGQLTVVAPDKDTISYEKWTDRTASRLSRSIRQATSLYRDSASTGYARVQFRLGEEGRPENISLAGSSASGSIDRISMRAIRSMGSLYPLPQDVRSGAKFEAWIIVANDTTERENMLTSLRAEHRAQTMAQAAGDRPILIAQR